MKSFAHFLRAFVMSAIVVGIIGFILYDIGFRDGAICERLIDQFIDQFRGLARGMQNWSDKLFSSSRYNPL